MQYISSYYQMTDKFYDYFFESSLINMQQLNQPQKREREVEQVDNLLVNFNQMQLKTSQFKIAQYPNLSEYKQQTNIDELQLVLVDMISKVIEEWGLMRKLYVDDLKIQTWNKYKAIDESENSSVQLQKQRRLRHFYEQIAIFYLQFIQRMYYSYVNYTQLERQLQQVYNKEVGLGELILPLCEKSYSVKLNYCCQQAYKYVTPMLDFVEREIIPMEYPAFTQRDYDRIQPVAQIQDEGKRELDTITKPKKQKKPRKSKKDSQKD